MNRENRPDEKACDKALLEAKTQARASKSCSRSSGMRISGLQASQEPIRANSQETIQENRHVLELERALKKWCLDRSKSWIVALSAGGDSAVLLDAIVALLSLKSEELTEKRIVIAHLDHGWRAISSIEAAQLKKQVEKYAELYPSLCFEMKRLEPEAESEVAESAAKSGVMISTNLEAHARDLRYQFFADLAKQYETPYLFLAHHSDDRRETVLKNLLEGKELAFISGLQEISQREGLCLLRPWLELEKRDLQAIAASRNLPFYEDESNGDDRFLRARIRNHLVPVLDQWWPKAWRLGLDQIARYSVEQHQEIQGELGLDSSPLTPQAALGGYRWRLPLSFDESNDQASIAGEPSKKPSQLKASRWRYFLRRASASIPSVGGEPLGREGSFRLWEIFRESQSKETKEEEKSSARFYRSKHYLWFIDRGSLYAIDWRCLEDAFLDDSNFSKTDADWAMRMAWQLSFQPTLEGDEPLASEFLYQWGPWEISRVVGAIKPNQSIRDQLLSGSFYLPFYRSKEPLLPMNWLHLGLISDPLLRSKLRRRLQRIDLPSYLRAWLPFASEDPVTFSRYYQSERFPTRLSDQESAKLLSEESLGIKDSSLELLHWRWIGFLPFPEKKQNGLSEKDKSEG